MSINANGLRSPQKRALLSSLLRDLRVGVGIITETHLRQSDLAWVKCPGYNVVAHHCRRTPVGQRIDGGVLILVHVNFTTAKQPKIPRLAPTIESCTTKIFPTENPITALRVTGVYIPPGGVATIKMETLKRLSAPGAEENTEETLPHIIGGDFNTTGWKRMYEEWLQTEGVFDLVDPQVPTYAGGTAIDKFLFVPGAYVPSTLLPTSYGAEPNPEHYVDAPHYPAEVKQDHLPHCAAEDYPAEVKHYPVMRISE